MLGFPAFPEVLFVFCPVCRDEYRSGFTRCATCRVDLVESLDATDESAPRVAAREEARPAPEPTALYCGFLSLEEARDAKRKMRDAGYNAEILIRDGEDEHGREIEEYWLLVPQRAFKAAQALVGFDHAETTHPEEILCSVCNKPVPEDAPECPHCGARFEDA